MKLKSPIILFFICLPLVTVLRYVQLAYMVEPATGFAAEENLLGGRFGTLLVTLMYTGIVVVMLILSRISGAWPETIPDKSKLLGGVSILLSITNFYEIVRITGVNLGAERPLLYNMLVIAVILSSLYYLIAGISCFVNYSLPPALSLLPVLFHILLLITTFMKYTALANFGESAYDVATLCLVLVFSLMYAKVKSGYKFEGTMKWIYGFGLSAALMCVIITLPRYIMKLRDLPMHNVLTLSPYFLIYAVFITVFLLDTLYFKRPVLPEPPVNEWTVSEDDNEEGEISNEN